MRNDCLALLITFTAMKCWRHQVYKHPLPQVLTGLKEAEGITGEDAAGPVLLGQVHHRPILGHVSGHADG